MCEPERAPGRLLFVLGCVALLVWAGVEFRAASLERRAAYRQHMGAAEDSLRRHHGIPTFPRLPDDPPGTVGDTLYVWWGNRDVTAVWPTRTPRRATDGR